MKTCNFIKNGIGLYLFDKNSLTNITNNANLKTALSSIFIFNFILSIVSGLIYGHIQNFSKIETIIIIFILIIFGFLIETSLIFILSGLIHTIYQIFNPSGKFKKIIILTTALNLIISIPLIIFIISFKYLLTHPNINYHQTLYNITYILAIIIFIWHSIASIETYKRIEKIIKIKSTISYLIVLIIEIIIIYFIFKF